MPQKKGHLLSRERPLIFQKLGVFKKSKKKIFSGAIPQNLSRRIGGFWGGNGGLKFWGFWEFLKFWNGWFPAKKNNKTTRAGTVFVTRVEGGCFENFFFVFFTPKTGIGVLGAWAPTLATAGRHDLIFFFFNNPKFFYFGVFPQKNFSKKILLLTFFSGGGKTKQRGFGGQNFWGLDSSFP